MDTTYNYRIEVFDGYSTETSVGSVKSLCSGTTVYCDGQRSCGVCSGGWHTCTASNLVVKTAQYSGQYPFGFRHAASGGYHYRTSESWTLRAGDKYDSCGVCGATLWGIAMGYTKIPCSWCTNIEYPEGWEHICGRCNGTQVVAGCQAHNSSVPHYGCSHNFNGVKH